MPEQRTQLDQLNEYLISFRIMIVLVFISYPMQSEFIEIATQKTRLPPWVIGLGILLFGSFLYSIAFDLIAVVGPGFATLRTLEGRDSAEHIRWLKYWVVFGVIFVLDSIISVSLGRFGHFIRFLILMWLLLPQTNGSSTVYDNLIAPFFKSNKETLDKALNSVQSKVGQGLQEVGQLAVGMAVSGTSGRQT